MEHSAAAAAGVGPGKETELGRQAGAVDTVAARTAAEVVEHNAVADRIVEGAAHMVPAAARMVPVAARNTQPAPLIW